LPFVELKVGFEPPSRLVGITEPLLVELFYPTEKGSINVAPC